MGEACRCRMEGCLTSGPLSREAVATPVQGRQARSQAPLCPHLWQDAQTLTQEEVQVLVVVG